MGRTTGFLRGAPAAFLAAAAAAGLVLGRASAQESCVQVSNTSFVPACPCDAGSELSFAMEGETTVTANTVNVALIIDGSGSVSSSDFLLSKEFAKNTVAAFAEQNLFDNGGTASFAQFSSSATDGGTFSSQAEFDAFVDAELQLGGGTDIPDGVERGRELLAAAVNTTASFMVVITDGVGGDPTDESDAARAEGTILYAVGVGTGPDEATLLAIAGDESNVFDVDDFTLLDTALEGIISTSEGSIPCAANGASITLAFGAGVVVVEATISDGDPSEGTAAVSADGGSVTFELSDTLEAAPTGFSVVLTTCDAAEGAEIVSSASYSDDEGNAPDLSTLEGSWATVPACAAEPTPAPSKVYTPTPAPTRDFSFSYEFSYGPDSWFQDDDDATFDYPSAPSPAPHLRDGSPTYQPVPPTATSPYTFCDNGFYGVQSGRVCCEAACGSCGGVGCSSRPGGADACCVTEIRDFGMTCDMAGAAPCYIGYDTDDDSNGPDGGGDDDDDDDKYSTSYSYDFSWTDDSGDSDTAWCSNGVPGIESSNGEVCCPVGCGQCGGVGCSQFGAPALDSYDCCVTQIRDFGEACAATGEAPCYL